MLLVPVHIIYYIFEPSFLSLHTETAVNADYLAVNVLILDDVLGQSCVFVWHAQASRARHILSKLLLDCGGQAFQKRGQEEAGGDGVDTHSALGQLTGDGKHHAHDSTLGGGVSGLADLALEGGNAAQL